MCSCLQALWQGVWQCDNAELLTEENDIEADEDEEDHFYRVIDDLWTMAGFDIYEEVVETDMDLN